LSEIRSFAVRSSGRDLTAVRRRVKEVVEPVAELVDEPVDPASLKKAELVELAESRGVDTSGTKADIVERLSDG
jgi:DNA topoisomerase IA